MPRAWEPTPEDVKAQLPARVGPAFTSTTIPSFDDVVRLCAQAAAQVELEVGKVPSALFDEAAQVATILTAYWVERRLFPEQQIGDGGPANALWVEYLRLLEALKGVTVSVGSSNRWAGTTGLSTPNYPPLDAA